jgi:hypothetical protein
MLQVFDPPRLAPYLLILEQQLTGWWCPVASSKALDLLHQALFMVRYRRRRIAMAISTDSKVGVFLHHHLFVPVALAAARVILSE